MKQGYVQVYTVMAGKTTAALGLRLRAAGRVKSPDDPVSWGTDSGELEAVKRLAPDFHIIRFAETKKFFWELTDDEKARLKNKTRQEMQNLEEYLKDNYCHVLILDEIMAAIHGDLVRVEQVCRIIDQKPKGMELVLTGRNVPDEIAERADLITEMKKIKHYMDKGVLETGIEY